MIWNPKFAKNYFMVQICSKRIKNQYAALFQKISSEGSYLKYFFIYLFDLAGITRLGLQKLELVHSPVVGPPH